MTGPGASKSEDSAGAGELETPTVSDHGRSYPLVNIQKAIENGHRNSEFTH